MSPTSPYSSSNQGSATSGSRRRSFLDVGGPNSINNFVSSVARAQSFSGSSLLEPVASPAIVDDLSPLTSPQQVSSDPFEHDSRAADVHHSHSRRGESEREQINHFHFPHDDAHQDELSPLIASPGTGNRKWSSASSTVVFSGKSTGPQTIFNSINTLMGIAMLSLPYGFKLCGWILGTVFLASSALSTDITAKMLGQILKKYPHVASYADLAYLYGGGKAQIIVTTIFSIDLLGASLSLILIFSDSFGLLFPTIPANLFKVIIVVMVFITSWVPLNLLSFLSVFGVFCTTGILVVTFICGFITTEVPGSLINSAPTYLWPVGWNEVLFSLGLFMAPWGGHAVFPEFFRDMKHPRKFSHCCDVAFTTTFNLDYVIAATGFLMQGSACQDSLAKNLMINQNYPNWVKVVVCLLMGLIPISKLPLIAKPIVTVYEKALNLTDDFESAIDFEDAPNSIASKSLKRVVARCIFTLFLLVLAMILTSFGQVVAFLGSAICFTICVTFPLLFYLKFFEDDLSSLRKFLIKLGVIIGIVGAIAGTYSAFVFDTNS